MKRGIFFSKKIVEFFLYRGNCFFSEVVVLDRERVLLSKGKGEGLFFMSVRGNGVFERGEIFA